MLSKDVKRIHLDFAHKLNDGHFGARKVWRKYLPRLKYHNPAISMTVNRDRDQGGPAILTVFFAPPPRSSSATASPAPSSSTDAPTVPSGHALGDSIETIDMKHKHESEILSRLLELTKGMPYEATHDELAELRDADEEKKQSERDREAQARLNEVKRQEKALLDLATGGAETA